MRIRLKEKRTNYSTSQHEEKIPRQFDNINQNTDVKNIYTFQNLSRHSDASPQNMSG